MHKLRLYVVRFRDESRRIRTFRVTAASPSAAAQKLKTKATIISVTKAEEHRPFPEFQGFNDEKFYVHVPEFDLFEKNGQNGNSH